MSAERPRTVGGLLREMVYWLPVLDPGPYAKET